jgi:hypothetical protein
MANMTTKKTVIALVASVGLGLLPLGLVTLSGCGDNPTDGFPFTFDAGSDARPDTGGGDGGGDGGGKPDTGTTPDTGTPPADSGADAPTDAAAG